MDPLVSFSLLGFCSQELHWMSQAFIVFREVFLRVEENWHYLLKVEVRCLLKHISWEFLQASILFPSLSCLWSTQPCHGSSGILGDACEIRDWVAQPLGFAHIYPCQEVLELRCRPLTGLDCLPLVFNEYLLLS